MPTILDRWEISIEELTELVDNNGSLRGIMLGYAAEYKLRKMWFETDGMEYIGKADDHDRKNKGDLLIRYRENTFSVESKSLQTKMSKQIDGVWYGRAQVDASDRRTITLADGTSANTTLLLFGEFDILAVNIFSFEDHWRFVFAKNSDLPHSTFKKYPQELREQLIASLVPVSWPPQPPFYDNPFVILDEIIEERERGENPPMIIVA